MSATDDASLKPTDLRGILRYVPLFRGHVFVIAIDGSIVASDNFANLLTDIAVLRSLNIKLVLVHGIGSQIKTLSQELNLPITDAYGDGVTDRQTLSLAQDASDRARRQIMSGLTRNSLTYAGINAVRATHTGIIKGVDHGYTGRIDKIDTKLITRLLDQELIPVFSPIAFDRDGEALRLNSDLLASELAMAIGASKLIYLSPAPGLVVDGQTLVNVPLDELDQLLKKNAGSIDERTRSKASYAVRALRANTPRAHILNGHVFGGLLTEIFDKVGLGTMIHANDYQQIRSATKRDMPQLLDLIRNAEQTDALRARTRSDIENNIDNYFLYEIDGSIIACGSLTDYPRTKTKEVAAVYVAPAYQGRGIGKKMIDYAEREALRLGAKKLIALSTQNFNFFHKICGFQEGSVSDLPTGRKKSYEAGQRKPRILCKLLG